MLNWLTFDVLDKPKPAAVAIDTRNGNLIRGTELREFDVDDDNYRDDFVMDAHTDSFDGTTDEYRR